jgi:NADPH-dependent glutamate synthase beta subunit-like oxidoreductase
MVNKTHIEWGIMQKFIYIIKGAWSLILGLYVTFKNFLRKPVTQHYPWEKEKMPPRFRGLPRVQDFLTYDKLPDHKYYLFKGDVPPCTEACPAGTDVRGYLLSIAERRYEDGIRIIKDTYPFAGSLGRICPAFCERQCNQGWAHKAPLTIRRLKRFLWDYDFKLAEKVPLTVSIIEPKDKRVAIIGAGPAGLTCATDLAKAGYKVIVYEKLSVAGGYLYTGIPSYRLPKKVLSSEIEEITNLGVEIKYNTEIGKDISWDRLKDQFDAVFIAAGALKALNLGIPGEEHPGVMAGEDFLSRINLGGFELKPKKVAVIGGGNTALDCVRTAQRLGAQAILLYRRTLKEMPAQSEEIEDAQAEGVEFQFLVTPFKIIIKEGELLGIECLKNKLGEPDASGRRKPLPIPGSEFMVSCDLILKAISRVPELPWLPKEIEVTSRCTIKVNDKTQATSLPGVWAGGDVTLGAATAIEAIACGKRAAAAMIKYLGK